MSWRRPLALLLFFVPVLLAACASTTVRKNPGPHDHGIRYYRPKPYLLLEPALGKSDELVTISLQYLPDFSEEYAIHVRTGIGKNKTSFKLENGWNLTEMNIDIDTELPQNIEAVAKLIEAVPKLRPTAGDQPKAAVKATNVPLGYYEAVVTPGPDGKKRLYGWRYVGFAPYAGCPQEGNGVDCLDCHAVYGLVFENGVMVFKPLPNAAYGDTGRNPNVVGHDPSQVPTVVQDMVVEYFTDDLKVPLDASKFDFGVDIPKNTYTAAPKITPDQAKALLVPQMAADVKALNKKTSDALSARLKKLPGYKNKDYKIVVTFPE
jgi:hypothetical protein